MRKQESILGVKFDIVNEDEALEKLMNFLEEDSSLKKVYTPNPEIVMLAQDDKELFRILSEADLVLADGIGVILASKIKGLELKDRVTGVDTMDKLLKYCGQKGKSIFIFGSKPGIAELACKNIEKKYEGIKIAGYHHGYFSENDEDEIINKINGVNPDVLFVCLGAPKQEKWIDKNKDRLNCSLAMGVGGSVDVYAGVAKRAPIAFQKLGLEWFYRLLKEPWRFKRMLVLPKFLIKFIVTK
ncbi:WecB/TagA/CpsF family glycosyltransferase [Alkaliphilus sp. B6464]|uniref:WecB/TagA/CpsF family glycosyltransferase n=1 Tax=Alkaliphilus sp. B6464 TaxID=2731219 RepID=UPI001BA98227|nr:WecB/TagA/CpsF family glycosyltransferase [Alkaliphilus sp. B6464]QUH18742.1 WecB/TagA/CpsF family glycosyltransferase [Alkaliphilus sp. B6464]